MPRNSIVTDPEFQGPLQPKSGLRGAQSIGAEPGMFSGTRDRLTNTHNALADDGFQDSDLKLSEMPLSPGGFGKGTLEAIRGLKGVAASMGERALPGTAKGFIPVAESAAEKINPAGVGEFLKREGHWVGGEIEKVLPESMKEGSAYVTEQARRALRYAGLGFGSGTGKLQHEAMALERATEKANKARDLAESWGAR